MSITNIHLLSIKPMERPNKKRTYRQAQLPDLFEMQPADAVKR